MRVLPFEADSGTYTLSALYVLLFLAGMSVGFDLHAFRIIQELKGVILVVPLAAVIGTVLGSLPSAESRPFGCRGCRGRAWLLQFVVHHHFAGSGSGLGLCGVIVEYYAGSRLPCFCAGNGAFFWSARACFRRRGDFK